MAFGNGGTIDNTKQAELREKRKSALFSSQENSNNNMVFPKNVIVDIPVELIDENPDNEHVFNMKGVDRLAEQIKAVGFDRANPVSLFEKPDGRYELSAGHRRYRANKLAGNETIPAVIKMDVSNANKAKSLLDLNLFNRVLTYYDYAQAVKYYKDNYLIPSGFTGNIRKEICSYFGISDTSLQRYMDFFKLIPELQEYAKDERFPGSALANAANLNSELQAELAVMIKQTLTASSEDKGITSREIISMVDTLKKRELYKEKKEKSQKQIQEQQKILNSSEPSVIHIKDTKVSNPDTKHQGINSIDESIKSDMDGISVMDMKMNRPVANSYGAPSSSFQSYDINQLTEPEDTNVDNYILNEHSLYEVNVETKSTIKKPDIAVAMNVIGNNIRSIKYEDYEVENKEKTVKIIKNAIEDLENLLNKVNE